MTTTLLSRRKKLFFAVLTVVVVIGLGEAGWRIYASHRLTRLEDQFARFNAYYESDPRLRQKLRPGDWFTKGDPAAGGRTCRFHVNEFRLRGPEVSESRSPGTLRILCLGGSTTFGSGCCADDLTYPARLERELAAAHEDQQFEVLNGGVPGYLTTDSFHNLERLECLQPDIVIVYHAANDIAWGERAGEHYFDPVSLPRPLSRLERAQIDADSFFPEAIFNRLRWARKLRTPDARPQISDRIIDGYADNLERIAERARGMGAVPCFVTFTTLIDSSTSEEEFQELLEGDYSLQLMKLQLDGLRAALEQMNARMRDTATKLDVQVIDIDGKVPRTSEYWNDSIHMTEAGSALMARIIAAELSLGK